MCCENFYQPNHVTFILASGFGLKGEILLYIIFVKFISPIIPTFWFCSQHYFTLYWLFFHMLHFLHLYLFLVSSVFLMFLTFTCAPIYPSTCFWCWFSSSHIFSLSLLCLLKSLSSLSSLSLSSGNYIFTKTKLRPSDLMSWLTSQPLINSRTLV